MVLGGMIGPGEILIIIAIVVLLFGANKIPELARSMGKAMGEFKKAQKETEVELQSITQPQLTKVQQMAKDLGIDITGKSDEELLDEINTLLPKKESTEP
jgi:sec-independent protein translocase protein TatA